MKHIRNIYFACREIGTALEYRILANMEEEHKSKIYDLIKEGFIVTKILANE